MYAIITQLLTFTFQFSVFKFLTKKIYFTDVGRPLTEVQFTWKPELDFLLALCLKIFTCLEPIELLKI